MQGIKVFAAGLAVALGAGAAFAADQLYQPPPAEPAPALPWYSNWYLSVGAAGFYAPRYEGDDSYHFFAQPLVSLGRHGGSVQPFTSRNDNISLGLIDTGSFRAGPVGKIVFPRDDDSSDDLRGLDPVRWGAEIGGFAEVYPTEWLRVRGEVRHGIRAHDGLVADLTADAFFDVTPTVRISGGPRLSFASSGYLDAYYGVDAREARRSGLAPYDPEGGMKSAGFGGAVTWAASERLSTSLFGEYERLTGPAADSSLVEERGDENQFTVGVSARYRFDLPW